MDRVLKDKQALDRQRQDKLISTVSQTLTSAVNAKLEKVVKSEMKSHVTPGVGGREGGMSGKERQEGGGRDEWEGETGRREGGREG